MTLPIGLSGTQWGVGQGGFHTHAITLGNEADRNTFRVIYDCGTASRQDYVNAAIDSYVDDLPDDSRIDLLVISHFDTDHVSGLRHLSRALAARSIPIKRIYVPFLTPLEMIFLAADAGTMIDGGPDDDGPAGEDGGAWYLGFLTDPVGILQGLFLEAQVLRLDPENYRQPEVDTDVLGIALEGEGDGLIVVPSPRTAQLRVGVSGSVPVWELVPYARDDVRAGTAQYYAALQKRLPAGILPAGGISALSAAAVRDLVINHRKDLSAACRTVKHPPNKTSVCLYSGPTEHVTTQGAWARNARAHQPSGTGASTRSAWYLGGDSQAAWLGTGDAELGIDDAVRQFSGFYGDRLSQVRILGVPHHGSRKNSCATFWDSMPGLLVATLHASGTQHGHPERPVLMALLQRAVRPVLVNDKALTFTINHTAP